MICHNKNCIFYIKEYNSCSEDKFDNIVIDENGKCENFKKLTKEQEELVKIGVKLLDSYNKKS